MNLQEQINQIVDQYIELLPVTDTSLMAKSEVKASKFLVAVAKLISLRDQLMNAKIKKDSLKSVAYAEAINTAPGTNAPTKQANAEANPSYLNVAEEVALIDNQLLHIKSSIDLFSNAHLLYRSLLKGEL